MNVIPLEKPDGCAVSAKFLREMADRCEAGEFDAVVLLSFNPSGRFLMNERGKTHNRLEMIGLLETIKADLMMSMETDDVL